jgi:hypothetical protein
MKALIATILILASGALNAQSILTGLVADSATFEPLPFVTVSLKKKSKGTITDSEGGFKIVAEANDTLVFQYLGYNTLEFPASFPHAVGMLTSFFSARGQRFLKRLSFATVCRTVMRIFLKSKTSNGDEITRSFHFIIQGQRNRTSG